ncbi:sensor histidine kinase [Pseudodesulfovibrio indicus]|uniref:sensor histidine kinase n=1 Tax=Pseudodesulfovibrio indicus TaxID=1716143 RepID=UPI00292E6A11|nr:sensor histidine kinase [Pseudodesulfovibrio indicus]
MPGRPYPRRLPLFLPRSPASPPVELSLRERNDGFSIVVKDHGIGIPEESIDHIFDPFYRVDESRARDTGGYGLGLYLCQTIMKAHGGHVAVESAPGAGTEVRLVFRS